MKVRTQFDVTPTQYENNSGVELGSLDKTSITSVSDFIQRFQADKSFAVPEVDMIYDTDVAPVDLDNDESLGLDADFDDIIDENAREIFKTRAKFNH